MHQRGVQPLWQRLKSSSYCKKIAPLFGETTVEGIKNRVQRVVYDREMRYNFAFESAPVILSSIKIEEIGSIR